MTQLHLRRLFSLLMALFVIFFMNMVPSGAYGLYRHMQPAQLQFADEEVSHLTYHQQAFHYQKHRAQLPDRFIAHHGPKPAHDCSHLCINHYLSPSTGPFLERAPPLA